MHRCPFRSATQRRVRTNRCVAWRSKYQIWKQPELFKDLQRFSLFVAFFFLVLQGFAGAQDKPTRRILILNEAGTSYAGTNLIDKGVRTALDNSPYKVEFYREYLDPILFPDADEQQRFRDFYIAKYKKRKPDVIITVGPAPLSFMVEAHQQNFPGIPIIYCLSNGTGSLTHDSDITGVEEEMAPAETLEAALRLQTGTKQVVVVGGASAFDRQQVTMVKERLWVYERYLDISYLTDLAMPALLDRLKHLPGHTIILLATL